MLAQEISADFVLIDDLAARAIAIQRGLPVTGLVGILVEAKRMNLVPSLKQVISELEVIAGFRVSDALKQSAFRSAGE